MKPDDLFLYEVEVEPLGDSPAFFVQAINLDNISSG
jgi:hypothetical protein